VATTRMHGRGRLAPAVQHFETAHALPPPLRAGDELAGVGVDVLAAWPACVATAPATARACPLGLSASCPFTSTRKNPPPLHFQQRRFSLEISSKLYADWRFDKQALPENLRSRWAHAGRGGPPDAPILVVAQASSWDRRAPPL
jgi:hypothetical protein